MRTATFREFVILMKNGKRIDIADAAKTPVTDGDEIAVFPRLREDKSGEP